MMVLLSEGNLNVAVCLVHRRVRPDNWAAA